MIQVTYGIFEAVLDEYLQDALQRRPELRAIFAKLDPEEQPAVYASFVARVLEQALREEAKPETRLALCNRILGQIAGEPGRSHLNKHRLVPDKKPILLEITPPNYGTQGIPRPQTPISESSLFTGSDPGQQLAPELQKEMQSADGVDILVSFIKWSGLRLLMPGFEDLRDRHVPVRLITTSYMGASDPAAVEWLARMPNVKVQVSYDVDRTRLHAKAYHFRRNTGFSTAYIGSANMSHAAITSGLEWNLKVTSRDMGHILEKFSAEFETYWNSHEFVKFDPADPNDFRAAIHRARHGSGSGPAVFFDLKPHPFQQRILDALERERSMHDRWRNLVIAATGTGKTVVAAFDFKRFYEQQNRQARLLYVAHREEILEKSRLTFASVLREQTFGELLVGQHQALRLEHLFCSVKMLANRKLWEQVGSGFFDFIVVDEVHHGVAASYRPIFERFSPRILLGLTATPERMDGDNVAADFGNVFAAEIRLPEALDEKLLCPFHYFGLADPIAIDREEFWRNGKYDQSALENVYVLDRARANQRLDAIISAIDRYEPDRNRLKGIGFCVTIKHAEFMASSFTEQGIASAAVVSDIDERQCQQHLEDLRRGTLRFLFTVDKLSEGIDIPDINIVLFLRPTDSLTVFLQQLGRGLRHAPEKDCLTVLDFVGQAHRRYRADTKFKALLPRHRFSIEKEVECNFPHLPAGCSIQLDKLSRQYVLQNIRENLLRLSIQVPDRLQTFTIETGQELTFANFVRYHDYEPEALLAKESWTGWKAKAQLTPTPADPDLARLRGALVRAVFINGPKEADLLRQVVAKLKEGGVTEAIEIAGESTMVIYYRIWGATGENVGVSSVEDAFAKLAANQTILADLEEVLEWSMAVTEVGGQKIELPYSCPLELHAMYGLREIQAIFGGANLKTSGQAGVGVFHFPQYKTYALLVTFQKTEREFSPSTMYADYPISRDLLHWESQSTTSERSDTGQNLIHHQERGYTILIFVREKKRNNGVTVPFIYVGPAERVRHVGERPIKMVWRLRHPMPVQIFEDNRRGG